MRNFTEFPKKLELLLEFNHDVHDMMDDFHKVLSVYQELKKLRESEKKIRQDIIKGYEALMDDMLRKTFNIESPPDKKSFDKFESGVDKEFIKMMLKGHHFNKDWDEIYSEIMGVKLSMFDWASISRDVYENYFGKGSWNKRK